MAWSDLGNPDSWADAVLECVEFNDKSVLIKIELPTGTRCLFKCENYIGNSYLGKWDEAVIARIYAVKEDSCIAQMKQHIQDSNPQASFEWRSLGQQYCVLTIELLDGTKLEIFCSAISVQKDLKQSAEIAFRRI